jgi:curved DNA-binding protein CbpA
MINGKTYYEILGVLPDAEDIVIRAAYRSLSQKYHPDKWTDDKKFSTERMSNINRSYEILSDATKRAKYDDELGASKNGTAFDSESDKEDEFQDFYSQSEKDWKLAIEYFPDIDGLFFSLKKINYGLAFGFRQTLIEKKAFSNALDIHKKLKQNFLTRYFGENIRIQTFAEALILNNEKKAALELNQAVKILGDTVDPNILINKILEKFPKARAYSTDAMAADKTRVRLLKRYATNLQYFKSASDATKVIDYLGGSVTSNGIIFSSKFYVELDNTTFEFTRAELLDFANVAIIKELQKYSE